MEQIRIVKEMRKATNNQYPKFLLWENVPGALSSNKGDDFRAVLEEAARCAENGVTIPQPKKWSTVGCIVGDGWSIAWRILDAQYFGVPQRRRRIFLVADFGSERAGEVLFKSESVCWDSAESGEAGKGIAADAEGGVDGSVYNESGQGYWMPDFGCLRAEGENRPTRPGHCVVQETKCYAIDALSSNSMKSKNPNSGFHEEDYVKCLDTTDTNPSKNQGGNVIVQEVKCLNPHDSQSQRIYDASGIYPCLSSNETGGQNRQAICLQANGIDRKDENGCNGKGWTDDVSYTLNTIDRHAVVFEPKSAFEENWAESTVKNALRAESSKSSHAVVFTQNQRDEVRDPNGVTALAAESGMHQTNYVCETVHPEVFGTICSSGAGTNRPAGQCNETDLCIVQKLASGQTTTGTLMACHAQKQWIGNQEAFSGNYHIVASGKNRKYIIRRLTPLECDRLQGYPDNWTQVPYKGKPMSDSARYRMDGNSVAIPCVVRVLGGIASQTQDIVSA